MLPRTTAKTLWLVITALILLPRVSFGLQQPKEGKRVLRGSHSPNRFLEQYDVVSDADDNDNDNGSPDYFLKQFENPYYRDPYYLAPRKESSSKSKSKSKSKSCKSKSKGKGSYSSSGKHSKSKSKSKSSLYYQQDPQPAGVLGGYGSSESTYYYLAIKHSKSRKSYDYSDDECEETFYPTSTPAPTEKPSRGPITMAPIPLLPTMPTVPVPTVPVPTLPPLSVSPTSLAPTPATATSSPTTSPTAGTLNPTVTPGIPTMTPTLATLAPTGTTNPPTMAPTLGTTGVPTASPTGSMDITAAPTSTQTAAPTGMLEVPLMPFTLQYTIDPALTPNEDDVAFIQQLTERFMDEIFRLNYDFDPQTSLDTFMLSIISFEVDDGIVDVNYEATATFGMDSTVVPTQADVDRIADTAFQSINLDVYLDLMKTLPESNAFSTTSMVVKTSFVERSISREKLSGAELIGIVGASAIILMGIGMIVLESRIRRYSNASKMALTI